MVAIRAPKRGDIVWLQFNPQAGSEQVGHRPALVISPKSYIYVNFQEFRSIFISILLQVGREKRRIFALLLFQPDCTVRRIRLWIRNKKGRPLLVIRNWLTRCRFKDANQARA
jgi:hypothetical protein